ncbi:MULTISPECIES: helix-turn-helix domain-containing protein [Enterobacteriaceae]|uniref:helix-turn-helix domain-containing protein n=1 Tax=Enterobacteriaceae TaxID=543 RepID=UPI0011A3F4E4|nr:MULTISPECIES: helix-turn-helix domain-containing protein [Enterobacteriaceae]WPO93946.1 helix-turn-helix domain-containing protein [Buttiauxella sp. HR94]
MILNSFCDLYEDQTTYTVADGLKMEGEETISYRTAGQETLADRLRLLIGNRSTRAAAEEWQLPYSTLNNYISRGTDPSFNVAIKIAERENVSLEWLAYGGSERNPRELKETEAKWHTTPKPVDDPLQFAWSMVYSSLDDSEREALLRVIHKEGVQGIMNHAEVFGPLARHIASLSTSEKARFMQEAMAIISKIKRDA